MDVPVVQIAQAMQGGSPALLEAVGRLVGLGQAEQEALLRGGFPRWSLFLMALAAGAVAGAMAQQRYPEITAKLIGRK